MRIISLVKFQEKTLEIKNQIQKSDEENKERIQAIDEELKQAGNIDKLTEDTVRKYIKTVYISGKGIEKIEYQ